MKGWRDHKTTGTEIALQAPGVAQVFLLALLTAVATSRRDRQPGLGRGKTRSPGERLGFRSSPRPLPGFGASQCPARVASEEDSPDVWRSLSKQSGAPAVQKHHSREQKDKGGIEHEARPGTQGPVGPPPSRAGAGSTTQESRHGRRSYNARRNRRGLPRVLARGDYHPFPRGGRGTPASPGPLQGGPLGPGARGGDAPSARQDPGSHHGVER